MFRWEFSDSQNNLFIYVEHSKLNSIISKAMAYKKMTPAERDAKRVTKRERIAQMKEQMLEEYEGFTLSELAFELNSLLDSLDRDAVQLRINVLRSLIKEAQAEMDADWGID